MSRCANGALGLSFAVGGTTSTDHLPLQSDDPPMNRNPAVPDARASNGRWPSRSPILSLLCWTVPGLLLLAPSVVAQEDPTEWQFPCPPVRTAESIVARIDSVAASPSGGRIDGHSTVITNAAGFPFTVAGPCPSFAPGTDLRAVPRRLYQHAIETSDTLTAAPLMSGLHSAIVLNEDLRPPPLALLGEAVVTGRTEGARVIAMGHRMQWSTEFPAAREAVLR